MEVQFFSIQKVQAHLTDLRNVQFLFFLSCKKIFIQILFMLHMCAKKLYDHVLIHQKAIIFYTINMISKVSEIFATKFVKWLLIYTVLYHAPIT